MSGATAHDSIGSADGTLTGSPSLVTGLVGDQAVQLANSVAFLATATQWMTVPHASFPHPSSMSLTWRGKNVALPGSNSMSCFASCCVPGSVATDGFSITYCRNSGVGLGWMCRSAFGAFPIVDTGPIAWFNSNAPNGAGTHYYAATYDENSATNWRFYIDAVELTLGTHRNFGSGKPLTYSAGYDLWIGRDESAVVGPPNDTIRGVAGILDDFRMYDGALNAQAITDRYADPTIP